MIDLTEVGVFPKTPDVAGLDVGFGIYLPAIHAADGYDVVALVIHERDRFDPLVMANEVQLNEVVGHAAGLWRGIGHLPSAGPGSLGSAGRYLYRYQLRRARTTGGFEVVVRSFVDPFAFQTDDAGVRSAFDAPVSTPFSWTDTAWRVPELDDLVGRTGPWTGGLIR